MSVSVVDLVVSVASQDDAAGMVDVIHAAFGARPALDPPSTASEETAATVAASLALGDGIYAEVDGRPAGAILVLADGVDPQAATFRRVSVHPDFQRHGIASAMVAAAEEVAARSGFRRVELFARGEFADLIAYWQHRGYAIERPAPNGVVLVKRLPAVLSVASAEQMRALGERLAGLLRAGDLVIATGDLGAGKTTLTQGIGRGLGTEGPVISPTFVISRIHASATAGPALVHVDAYRLTSAEELDDLDLDATLPEAVTLVEWGAGLAEGLATDRLEIEIVARPEAGTGPDTRLVALRGTGVRWRDVNLSALAEAPRD
ncbi:tRNA (adenosine(37)-N6)-threonylcarbamoyltransferase complex ATPase subunit type 1 TsaE [uncultured Friedmanniella sp.]|uniref:tRNA (adenosine(37)-N6)-threonylcarbamoyltransferase complex ATPase subunit type 1 TsaE n=1 Tax=uncultured Friedmanniella sp. TaxID=335381 RepID=UPI0035CAE77F